MARRVHDLTARLRTSTQQNDGRVIRTPLHLKRLHHGAITRFNTLPDTHILRYTALPHKSHNPAYTSGFHVRSITKANSHLPLHALAIANNTRPSEKLFRSLPDMAPGHRIVDTFSSRITYDTTHPKKKNTDDFETWLSSFKLDLSRVVLSNVPYGFTDGSAHTGPSGYSTAAAYHTYRGSTRTHTHTFRASHALAIDAELIALGTCIQRLIRDHSGPIHTYTDSSSAIALILDTSPHTSHSISVVTARRLSEWFAKDERNTLTMHWCPGHHGVQQNDDVDAEANQAVATAPPNSYHPLYSLAWAKQSAQTESSRAWAGMAKSSAYRGYNLITGKSVATSTKKGGRFLKDVGGNDLVARCARALLSHAPTGEYRLRFFPDKPSYCDACGVLHSRVHILNSCVRYRSKPANFLAALRLVRNPEVTLSLFLSKHPKAFSFDDAPIDVDPG